MISATAESLVDTRCMSLIDTVNAMTRSIPRTAAVTTDPTIARGTSRNGFFASSAMFAAASKPTSVDRPMIIAAISPPWSAK
nr:hypothetical protein CPGR_03086 [Mycolicibacterium komanii]